MTYRLVNNTTQYSIVIKIQSTNPYFVMYVHIRFMHLIYSSGLKTK